LWPWASTCALFTVHITTWGQLWVGGVYLLTTQGCCKNETENVQPRYLAYMECSKAHATRTKGRGPARDHQWLRGCGSRWDGSQLGDSFNHHPFAHSLSDFRKQRNQKKECWKRVSYQKKGQNRRGALAGPRTSVGKMMSSKCLEIPDLQQQSVSENQQSSIINLEAC
jgi:hypothetical protein